MSTNYQSCTSLTKKEIYVVGYTEHESELKDTRDFSRFANHTRNTVH